MKKNEEDRLNESQLSKSTIDELNNRIENLEKDIQLKEQSNKELTENLTQFEIEKLELQSTIDRKQSEIDQLTEQLSNAQKSIENLNETDQQKTQSIENLNERIHTFEQNESNNTNEIKKLRRLVKDFQSQLQRTQNRPIDPTIPRSGIQSWLI